MEFDHVVALKERFKGKPVDFIYLCTISRIDHQVKWKEIIKDKHITGYHIPINDNLYEHIWREEIGKEAGNMFMIPRYCIIKGNKIIVPKAEYPSTKDKLYNQIDSVLNL